MLEKNIYADFLNISKWKIPEVLDCQEIWKNIASKTNLSPELIEKIINFYFLEIKINLLRGKIVYLKNFGHFFISSPQFSEGKRKIYPNFKLSIIFRKILNGIQK